MFNIGKVEKYVSNKAGVEKFMTQNPELERFMKKKADERFSKLGFNRVKRTKLGDVKYNQGKLEAELIKRGIKISRKFYTSTELNIPVDKRKVYRIEIDMRDPGGKRMNPFFIRDVRRNLVKFRYREGFTK